MGKVKAIRILKEEAGFSVQSGKNAVEVLLELAQRGEKLDPENLLFGNKGSVPVGRIYAVLGVA